MKQRFTPGKRLSLALLLLSPLFFLGPLSFWIGLFGDALLLACALAEARALARRLPTFARTLPTRLSIDSANPIEITLQNGSNRRIRGTLRDDQPNEFRAEPSELAFDLPPRSSEQLSYRAFIRRRGQYRFGDLHARLEGRFGLGSLTISVPAGVAARVYPNLGGPRRYELALRRHALHSVGVRNVRRIGGAGEFEQLREYVPGDALRDFEWKASAKRLRPITRVHGQEQSQSVLLAIDTGRMMGTRLDEFTKLDHAIHAALLLAWVALRAGDKVGLLLFASDVQRFLPPARGRAQYLRILETLYAVEASPTYVDFRELARFVRARLPRRSLLLLFSDLLDESQALPLAAELPKLRAKHLPLCITMSDPVAARLAEAPVSNREQVYLRAAAADLLAERTVVKKQLARAGVSVLETRAADLAVATVNRYLEIKRQHRL
ncbi:MAG TPA: DUF58 domain-containing protein [Polyangiales bacterium]